MTHTIKISDAAHMILMRHMKDAGQGLPIEDEMDELFAESEHAWAVVDPAMANLVKMLKQRGTFKARR